jgi:hypothetical protein
MVETLERRTVRTQNKMYIIPIHHTVYQLRRTAEVIIFTLVQLVDITLRATIRITGQLSIIVHLIIEGYVCGCIFGAWTEVR